MIRIPDVLLGQRARAFESCDCSEIDPYGWAFLCPDTKVIVHSDGVTKYKIVPVTFSMPSAPKAGCISYNALYYVLCEDGKVYEYSPMTRTVLRSFQVTQPDSTATSWISVSRSRYSSLTVQSVMYVLAQGASGELVAIRLPDGQMFRGGLGIGDLVGGVIDSTPGGNVENYPDSIPSQVINPLTNPMGPLSCHVVTRHGDIVSVQLTPLFGFVTKSTMQNTALSNVVRVVKPFASRAPLMPPIIPPSGIGYDSSYVVSVRLAVPTYGGPCLRVRRSSDNSEKDIWFYRGWVDEAELLAFVGSGNGFVTAWYNQTPQYGAVSFTNADVLSQPQIVSSGNVIRSGGSLCPAVLFVSTGKTLYAPGGAYWLTASNKGMFMSAVSSSTIGSPGSLTRGLFGQYMPDGNSPAFVGRWFTGSDQAHRVRLDLSLADIITDDRSIYPTLPLTDTNISASRSGSVRIYARGALNVSTQVTFPDRTGRTLRNTVIRTEAGVTDVKMFEIIAQSQAWSEAYQLDLSKNQMLAFGIPGVY